MWPQDTPRRFLVVAFVFYVVAAATWAYIDPKVVEEHFTTLFHAQIIFVLVTIVVYVWLTWREVVADRKEREGDA